MEYIEGKMKKLLLASIGAAAVTREQSDALLRGLVKKGEEVVECSGIRDEYLRYNDGDARTGDVEKEDTDAWLETLCSMSSEQLQVLKDAIAAVESASRQVAEY